jgi:S-formylglutathione hydrolase FrmB
MRRRVVALAVLLLAGIGIWLLVRAVSDVLTTDKHGAELTELEIRSEAVGETLPVNVVVPESADGDENRPLLVFLHGRADDGDGEDSNLSDEMYAALADQGDRAPVVAFPSGGEASYWHDRADGEWGAWVTDEVIPRVAKEFGADRGRVAIGGISMGGYGAFDIAQSKPGRFCAVGGHSAALWTTAGETAPGAFDDAEDFEEHDVIGAAQTEPGPYLSQPVWVDAGDADPFQPGIQAFTVALEAAGADLTAKTWPGDHTGDYWRSHWDDYMRFYSRALADC